MDLPSKLPFFSVICNALLALNMIKRVAWDKWSLLPNSILQNTQTLQLYTMTIQTRVFTRDIKNPKLGGLGR